MLAKGLPAIINQRKVKGGGATMPRLLVRLGVVRFVKDEKRDLLHLDETVCQRVQEQLTRHD